MNSSHTKGRSAGSVLLPPANTLLPRIVSILLMLIYIELDRKMFCFPFYGPEEISHSEIITGIYVLWLFPLVVKGNTWGRAMNGIQK